MKENITRNEFLLYGVVPAFLWGTAYTCLRSEVKGDYYTSKIFKDFKFFRRTFLKYMDSLLKDENFLKDKQTAFDLSREQVKDYLNHSNIERDYLRILWKYCNKNEIMVHN